jgi:SAM-dependent methyltransferase
MGYRDPSIGGGGGDGGDSTQMPSLFQHPLQERRGVRDGPRRALAERCMAELELRDDDLLVDLCCGAEPLCAEILRSRRLRYQVVAVDPSADVLARLAEGTGMRAVRMDARSFAAFPARYDKILAFRAWAQLREPAVLAGLRLRLAERGVLLVVEPSPTGERGEDVAGALRAAGFAVRTSSSPECYDFFRASAR